MADCVVTFDLAKAGVPYVSESATVAIAVEGDDGAYYETTGKVRVPLTNSPLATRAFPQDSYVWIDPPDSDRFLVQIPSAGSANLSDIPHIDPASLSPIIVPPPVWEVTLDSHIDGRITGKQNVSTLAADVATQAANGSVLDIAVTAKVAAGIPFVVVDGGTALDTLLAGLPAWSEGDALRYIAVKPGAYTRAQGIHVPSGTVLSLYGCTFTLAADAGDDVVRNADRVAGNSWIWILGGHLNGNAANQANESSPNGGQSGVSIYNSHHVWVKDVFSKNTFRHGFDASTDTYANPTAATCTDINFIDCTATSWGDDGFTTHYANSVTFRGCTAYNGTGGLVANGASHGFEFDDGSADVIAINCTSYNNSRGRGFYIKSHSSSVYHARFQLIGCEAYGNANQGFGITSEGTGVSKLSDISLVGCWSHGNTLDGLRITNAANITVTNYSSYGDGYGIRIVGDLGTDSIPMTRDITIDGFRIVNPGHQGIWMNETSVSRAVRFSDGLIKGVTDDAIYAGQPDATFDSIIFEGVTVCAVRIKATASRVVVRDCEFWDFTTTCINLQDGVADIDLDGLIFHPPAAGNTHAAVEVPAAATVSRISLRNSRLLGAWVRGFYIIATATVAGLSIQNNDLSAATLAGVTNSGTLGGDVSVTGNVGYLTRKIGTGTIANAASSTTITHGLGGVIARTPTSISLGKRTSEDVWVSARTGSSFTVTRTGTTGALTFDYIAEYQQV